MSDVLSDAQMYLSEPDETVLTAALRNKDDIPILMDVVGDDDVSTPVSQETHLKKSLFRDSSDLEPTENQVADAVFEKVSTLTDATLKKSDESIPDNQHKPSIDLAESRYETDAFASKQHIENAIRRVLEKRLPELVSEVLLEIEQGKRS